MTYGGLIPEDIATVRKHLYDPNTALGRYIVRRRNGYTVPEPCNPPANSSAETVLELNEVVSTMVTSSPTEHNFAFQMDDLGGHYGMWAKRASKITGESYDWKWFDTMAEQGDGLNLYLKSHFNRPRPYQLGPLFGKQIERTIPDPQTPSYPSGHAFDAGMFSEALSQRHPQFREVFESLAERIAKSRIVAGVHYPSDCEAGIILGREAITSHLVDIPA